MATYYQPPAVSSALPLQYASPATAAAHIPPGTFTPGTKVQVGHHRVIIEKYLSEGGFAHVYVVRVPSSKGGSEVAVLKRVAVPDKDALASMRTEVETMKKLKGHSHIVTYMDSHASQLKGGGYEVFLLMEYCEGGGLIDFMNTRLKDRLTEPEILKIFSDAAEGVACMHYLKPPLLHRDLKVENILISLTRGGKFYKLCDFGSAASPRPAATSAAEGRLIEDDIQRHTTLQYRSPEMIDVYRKRPIDEKSDIWALGVLLYKLCYYTTPFEEQGQMAILTASFKYPAYPVFSDRLKLVIASMLSEDPRKRPNIYEVLSKVCSMRGKEVPIKDIYTNRTASEARKNQKLPTPPSEEQPILAVSKTQSAPALGKPRAPEITPMRRGRPAVTSRPAVAGKPNPSPGPITNKDPFAALDISSSTPRAAAVDEKGAKFPALEQFSLLQEKGSGFKFNGVPQASAKPDAKSRIDRAEENPAQSQAKQTATDLRAAPTTGAKTASLQSRSARTANVPIVKSRPRSPPVETFASRPKMVSSGTMTSRPSSPEPALRLEKPQVADNRPIWRVPAPSASRPIVATEATPLASYPRNALATPHNGNHGDTRGAKSERPSVDNIRGSYLGVSDSIQRSKSLDYRSRDARKSRSPHSDRSQEAGSDRRASYVSLSEDKAQDPESAVDDTNIESNVDFLRVVEEEGGMKGHERRKSSSIQRIKNASMPALSNTKNMLTGKFSDAFRRFESGGPGGRPTTPEDLTTREIERLSPVAQSASPAPSSFTGSALDETEDLSPEMRREMERRQLFLEEKRVSEAAAAYRQRLANVEREVPASRVGAGSSKASAIQARVKNLLDESGRASPVKKTAEGYGKYTNSADSATSAMPQGQCVPTTVTTEIREVNPTVSVSTRASAPVHRSATIAVGPGRLTPAKIRNPAMRPSAPPKPVALRTGGGTPRIREALPGQEDLVPPMPPDLDVAIASEDVDSFSKRYPSLSLELVEAEISSVQPRPERSSGLRIRDV